MLAASLLAAVCAASSATASVTATPADPVSALAPVQEPAPAPSAARVLLDEERSLPHLGLRLRERRVLDPASGRIRSAGTLADGRAVDAQALLAAEQAARVDAMGGVSRDLAAHLATVTDDAVVDVVFWLDVASPDWRALVDAGLAAGLGVEDARREAWRAAVDWYAQPNAAFADRLRDAGFEVFEIADAWPNVFARVPARALAAWAADPAVDMAYRCFPTWESELEAAQGTMRTFTVWDRGNTAHGSPVKVMVNDTGDVTSANPYLPPISYLTTIGTGSHATSVAGNIAMDHPSLKGAAHGIPQLYSGGGAGDSAAPGVWSAAIAAGVSFGNCSWWNGSKGSIVWLDRYFDHTIRNFAVMMFKSTGNQGNTGSPYTTTPGNGYNMTNSGSYTDHDNHEWTGDSMASYSSYWDPVEGHEKPELANAGDGVDTADTNSPWIDYNFGGTSSASPLTCGVATLIAGRAPTLAAQPEAVKAILMASAWHNIEGAALLSEFDGAGGVHAGAADAVVRDGQYVQTTLTSGSFTGGVYDVPFEAYRGDETRIVALWFSNPDSALTTDRLEMDLDATVLDPSGNVVATSASSTNPFEIAGFVPAVSGTHTLRLSRIRFNGASEPLAVAWSSRLDTAVAEVVVTGTPTLGSTLNLEFRNQYDGNVDYQAHISTGTLPDTIALGGGWALPLRDAPLVVTTGNWPGFSGTLDPGGTATTSGVIPNRTGLVGRTFYVAMYTHVFGVTQDVSEAVAVTIQ